MDNFSIIKDKILRNRISSTEVSDCMDKTGAVNGVYALNRGHFKVGPVFWVYAYNASNWETHEQLRNAPEGSVLIVEAFDCDDRAIFGHLVSKFLLLYRQVAAIVVIGKLRDVPHLIKENWPIWYSGPTPIGCYNRKNEKPFPEEIIQNRKKIYDGAIAICDDSGVVVVPSHMINKDFLEKLDWIEELEDTWFDCIDRLKWDTYETVCLKKYLNEKK